MTMNHKGNGAMLDKIEAAFQRASKKVIEIAKRTGTPVIVWKDGRVQEVSPDQIAEQLRVDKDKP